ncbi:hypothetical protein HanIR_Chr10g0466941 [Helianthus annuus]|nr:hypothetical protein HanIR_Chr10g0466941 [Helianthus annuus]
MKVVNFSIHVGQGVYTKKDYVYCLLSPVYYDIHIPTTIRIGQSILIPAKKHVNKNRKRNHKRVCEVTCYTVGKTSAQAH